MPNFTLTGRDVPAASVYDSYAEKQFLAALYVVISVAGALGNSSVLLAVGLSRKPRTVTNVFVVNLAVADLITCLSLPIMTMAVLSENRKKLMVSESLCAFQGFILIACIGCSMKSIASIAVYRAFITRRKGRSRAIWFFNHRGVAAIVAVDWLVPFAVGLLPIVSEFGSYEYDDKLSTCSFNPTAPGSGIFSIILILGYTVHLLVIFVSYSLICCTVRKHFKRIRGIVPNQPVAVVSGVMRPTGQAGTSRQQHPAVLTNRLQQYGQRRRGLGGPRWAISRQPPPAHVRQPQPARARLPFRRNLEVTRSLFLVVFFFVLCGMPYFVMAFLPDRSLKIVPFFGALLVSNSCINPVIYAAWHPDFMRVCRCIILCRFSKIPMKSAFLRRLLRE